MTEFELIARYFDRPLKAMATTRLGIGDDCALLAPRAGHELAISTDMLVAGRHFYADADAASLGWKTLAVNLSDLAAMGASPLAFTLALALPAVDEPWLAAFSAGLFECANAHDCPLVGGDTTRGPLTLGVTVFGDVPEGRALRRSAAQADDDVWVSGVLGAAAAALGQAKRSRDGGGRAVDADLLRALDRPTPRVALGVALRGIANAAIDVSDGLAQDLGHVLDASRCGADIDLEAIPASVALARCDAAARRRAMLAGGDDYELCFTAPAARRQAVASAGLASNTPVTRIGTIRAQPGLTLLEANGEVWHATDVALRGFDHFA